MKSVDSLNTRLAACMSLVALGAALSLPASAQIAPPSINAMPSADQVQDIVVTAQRRDESLAKTPVAVSVLSSATLAKAQITSEQDLRTVLPGLAIRAGTNTNQSNYAVRGASQDVFSNTKPGVMPYINEVQVGGAGGSTAFYDLQSVQLLKGPQGTLFGRSATGGAVLFTTKKPDDTFGGYASMSVGDYSEEKFEGAINLPVNDKLSLRIAGFEQRRDGYQRNLYDNSELGGVNRWGARVSASAKITNRLRNDLVVDYYHADNTNIAPVVSGLMPFTGTPPPYVPLEFLYAGTATPAARATGIATLQTFSGAPLAAATAYYDAYFADPKHPSVGLAGVAAQQAARGPYIADASANMGYKAENWLVTNTTAYELTDSLAIKNIFGYSNVYNRTAYEVDGTPYVISENGPLGTDNRNVIINTRSLSDEFQAQGKVLNQRLQYVLGFYFSDERYTSFQQGAAFDIIFGGIYNPYHYLLTNRTYAPYFQGSYHLSDTLSVTVGGRYTSERTGYHTLSDDVAFVDFNGVAPPGYSFDQSHTFNKISWHGGIEDQVNSHWLVYLSSGQAYKSGGFNGSVAPRVGSAADAGNAYAAEKVIAVEVGSKFQGGVGGMPTRLNIALYHNWISDRQTVAETLVGRNPAALTVNVPSGIVEGVEVDGLIKPVNWLTLGGTINYTHAKFDSAPAFVNGILQVFDQVPDAPRFSGSVYSDVAFSIARDVNLILHGDLFSQSNSFLSPQSNNNYGTILSHYAIADFRVGVESGHRWSLTANVKNAFNRTYYVGGIPTGPIFQINSLIPGEPRMFTVEARVNF